MRRFLGHGSAQSDGKLPGEDRIAITASADGTGTGTLFVSQVSSNVDSQEVSRTELSQVYCAEDPQVDIVFVHGLNGHPQKTWTASNGTFWPRDLLPANLGEVRARILVWGYNADVYAFGGKSTNADYVHAHALTLVANLVADRLNANASRRPIIFVAHSLGGIVVKRALNYCSTLTNPNTLSLRSIFVSTYGIIFLGTPHNGADPARWGLMLQSICQALLPRKMLDTEPQLVAALQTQSETLQNINLGFMEIMPHFRICFFYETLKTNFGVTQDLVVDRSSASPDLPGAIRAGIDASHSGMCKFESSRAPGYPTVSGYLKHFTMDSLGRIALSWDQELARQTQENKLRAMELLGPGIFSGGMLDSVSSFGDPATQSSASGFLPSPDPSTHSALQIENMASSDDALNASATFEPSPEPAGPLLVTPAGFRPNKIFVGMERELQELHEKLLDPDTRAKGSACVILWCLSGGGKSHLARQYVYGHREHYPGGIFWVRARSKVEITCDFWDIAQKVALKDVQDPRTATYEHDAEKFVQTVRLWFEKRQGWLLVFDGIAIDQDAEKSDLQAFIPDGRGGSVILTSVDKSLAGSRRLCSPSPIKVSSLAEHEARELLFQDLLLRQPSSAEVEKATEIVRRVGRLPLAIHAIGYRIRATGEPLASYRIRTYSSESKLREPFLDIMNDLERLRHTEARNLINVLGFFGRHVPFGMIHLGIPALLKAGVDVRASEAGRDADLNTTVSILIRYALVERNEPDDSASHGSHPSLVEAIDMLKMHGVVQSIFCDELRAAGLLQDWLDHAVTLFCASYAAADARIKRVGGERDGGGGGGGGGGGARGLVKDYREYELHGKRLLEHVTKHGKRIRGLEAAETHLTYILDLIAGEIRRRTPQSSQEVVIGQEIQVSVFDRTSSTSEPDGPETPLGGDSRASSVRLLHDTDPTHGGFAPYPIITPNPPSLLVPLPDEDDGYLSDMERRTKPATVRPARSRTGQMPFDASTHADMTGPRVHRTISRRNQHRPRDSVSPWRSVSRAVSTPKVSAITALPHATTTGPRAARDERSPSPSEAQAFLRALRERSPPSAGENSRRRDRPWLRRPSGSETAARRVRQPRPSPTSPRLPTTSVAIPDMPSTPEAADEVSVSLPTSLSSLMPGAVPMARGGSEGSSRGLGGRELHSTAQMALAQSIQNSTVGGVLARPRLARPTDSKRSVGRPSSPSGRADLPLPSPSSDPDLSTRPALSPRPHRTSWQSASPSHHFNRTRGGDVSASVRGKTSTDTLVSDSLEEPHRPHKLSSSTGNLPARSEYVLSSNAVSGPGGIPAQGRRPTGYNSEPMSRETSGQSATGAPSVTGTEPSRFPPQFSPYSGASPLIPQSRIRPHSGLRGSPMVPARVSVADATPRYAADQDFAAMGGGGWTTSSSGSGPGLGTGRSTSGGGIHAGGKLTRFGETASVEVGMLPTPAGSGSPSLLRAGPGAAPYPAHSLMPHAGSSQVDLVDPRPVRGRVRGHTSPTGAGPAIGLGVHVAGPTSPRDHDLVRIGSEPHLHD